MPLSLLVRLLSLKRKKPPHWPVWAQRIRLYRQPQDTGVGDTIERVIGPDISENFKKWHFAIFRRNCNCKRRKEQWNTQYSYGDSK